MKSKLHNLSFVCLVAVAVFSLSSGFATPAGDMVTPAQIAAAKSPADHESIARAYEAEAASYDKKVELHKAMQKSYGVLKSMQSTGAHCDKLATNFESAAQEYRALAAEHRAMAKNIK
jgi:uncharacterized membrane protein (DUF2068 family)